MGLHVQRIGFAVGVAFVALGQSTLAQLPPAAAPTSPLTVATVRTAPLSETERAVHLLSRATYGVRPFDVSELLALGMDSWLQRQLQTELLPRDELLTRVMTVTSSRRVPPPAGAMTPPALAVGIAIPERQVIDKLLRAAYSRRQLEEVMADFWFNHFNVNNHKTELLLIGPATAHYEQTAIRPHVFGRFQDMLLAVARHPAMLAYLDNHLSTAPGPDAPGGGGINENYARELLELHTLGVDGGYTQEDVVEVARAFTGWTVLMARQEALGILLPMPGALEMVFRPEWHDFGGKVILGQTLEPGWGVEDGEEVISLLARHRSTARHIATKLVRHFVADDPPADLVEEIAAIFLATDGDLREVTRALFTSEAFYRPEHYRAKVRRPFELVASTLRFSGARPAGARVTLDLLNNFGHVPYVESSPTGYPTTADEWMGAGAILARANYGLEVAAGRHLEGPIDAWALLGLAEGDTQAFVDGATRDNLYDPQAITRALMVRMLQGLESPVLESAIRQALDRMDRSDFPALVLQGFGVLVGSADFQRY